MIEALNIAGNICSIIGLIWSVVHYIMQKRKEKSEPSGATEAR